MVETAYAKCVDDFLLLASYNGAVHCAAIRYVECVADESLEYSAGEKLNEAIEAANIKAKEDMLNAYTSAVFDGASLLRQINGRLSDERDEFAVITDAAVDDFMAQCGNLPRPSINRPFSPLPSSVTPYWSLAQIPPPPRWLVQDVIEARGLTLLVAPSNAGKSVAALDIGMCIATGQEWRGHRILQGAVLFNAAEAASSLKDRVRAWGVQNSAERPPFFVDDRAYDLTDKSEADALIWAARSSQIIARRSLALLVVDTLAASFGGNDENPGPAMQAFLGNVNRIREATSAAVLVLHHPNAAGDPRGHSSLKGAADTILRIDGGCLVDTKQRSGIKGTKYPFRIVGVEIGKDAAGRAITAAVIDHQADTKAATPAPKTFDPLPLLVESVVAAQKDGKPLRLNKPNGLHCRRASLPAPLSKWAATRYRSSQRMPSPPACWSIRRAFYRPLPPSTKQQFRTLPGVFRQLSRNSARNANALK